LNEENFVRNSICYFFLFLVDIFLSVKIEKEEKKKENIKNTPNSVLEKPTRLKEVLGG